MWGDIATGAGSVAETFINRQTHNAPVYATSAEPGGQGTQTLAASQQVPPPEPFLSGSASSTG